MKLCVHWFVDGFGGMGDALTCRLCGLSKYPEAMPIVVTLISLLGRITRENSKDWRAHFVEAQAAAAKRGDVENG